MSVKPPTDAAVGPKATGCPVLHHTAGSGHTYRGGVRVAALLYGAVSYALHGAALLDTALDSSQLASWGAAGAGVWITVYGRPDHAYAVIAGLRLDTSGTAGGPRWHTRQRSGRGYTARHPVGL